MKYGDSIVSIWIGSFVGFLAFWVFCGFFAFWVFCGFLAFWVFCVWVFCAGVFCVCVPRIYFCSSKIEFKLRGRAGQFRAADSELGKNGTIQSMKDKLFHLIIVFFQLISIYKYISAV